MATFQFYVFVISYFWGFFNFSSIWLFVPLAVVLTSAGAFYILKCICSDGAWTRAASWRLRDDVRVFLRRKEIFPRMPPGWNGFFHVYGFLGHKVTLLTKRKQQMTKWTEPWQCTASSHAVICIYLLSLTCFSSRDVMSPPNTKTLKCFC